MKKNLPYLLIIIALVATLFVVKYQKDKSLNSTNVEFRIEDINEIGSIEIADKYGKRTNLLKKENSWFVDGNYPAQQSNMITILEVINKIEIEAPVSDSQRKIAIENLKNFATEVKIKDKSGDEIKTIFIGGEFRGGNYMILSEKGVVSADPYLVRQPGFKGNLKYKFSADPKDWKSTLLFGTLVDKLAKIDVSYSEHPEHSFVVLKDEELIKIEPSSEKYRINKHVDQSKMIQFLLEFEAKHFEGVIASDTLHQRIKTMTPFVKIAVTDIDHKTKSVWLYRRPASTKYEQMDAQGKKLPFDLDKYWSFIPESKEYVVSQHYVLGPILMTYEYFFVE
ncbi:MAG: DUF4340 domain-containing protein [Chitinophagales bacterium]